jgi:hypothetical protein
VTGPHPYVGPGPGPGWPSPHPWVRPYVVTGGRITAPRHVLVHSQVSGRYFDPAVAAALAPEARRLYRRACERTESLAELSAHCAVPLGVTRVLLADLAEAGHIQIGADTEISPFDPRILERVLDGLRQLA